MTESQTSASNAFNTSILLSTTTSLLMETNLSTNTMGAERGAMLLAQYFSDVADWVRVLCGVLAVITMVSGTPANLMIILAVYRTRSLRTSMNALVVNLMVADLLGCLVCCPVLLVLASSTPPPYICKLFDFSHILSGTVQLTTIAFLSFERYQAIRKPFDQEKRLLRIRIGIIVCWIVGVVLCIVSVCMTSNPILYLCENESTHIGRYEFGLYIFLPLSFASVTAIIVFYMRIVFQINDHIAKREKRLAWKRKVNKVNPIMSVTLALVQGTSTTPTQEASHEVLSRFSVENARCSTLRTSMSDTEILSSNFDTPKRGLILPGTVSGETPKPENTPVRKTKSASEASGIRLKRDGLTIKPKFSQDSKMRQVGYGPIKVQGFLTPSRKGSYYHSDDELDRRKTSSAVSVRSRGSATSEPVTFTALEKLQVLDPGGLDRVSYGQSTSSSIHKPSGQRAKEGARNLDKLTTQILDKDNTYYNTETSNAHPFMKGAASDNKTPEITIADSSSSTKGKGVRKEALEGAREQGIDNQKPETSKVDEHQTLPKRPTRRTAVIDIVQIHDFDGSTTRAKVASEEIVGDICVMNKESKERGKRKVEQRTAKRTAIIIVAFLCCWTPLLMSIMASVVLDKGSHDAVRMWCEAYLVTLTLALLAAVINPVIYGVINNQFRSALVRMLKGFRSKWCKKPK